MLDETEGLVEPPKKSRFFLIFSMVYAMIGVIIGVSVFFTFGIKFKNWHAAVWGLLSGIVALGSFLLHHWHAKGRHEFLQLHLKKIMINGCVLQLASLCGFVAYLSIAINRHEKLTTKGYYLVSVWCAAKLKFSFALFYHARSYKKFYRKASKLRNSDYSTI